MAAPNKDPRHRHAAKSALISLHTLAHAPFHRPCGRTPSIRIATVRRAAHVPVMAPIVDSPALTSSNRLAPCPAKKAARKSEVLVIEPVKELLNSSIRNTPQGVTNKMILPASVGSSANSSSGQPLPPVVKEPAKRAPSKAASPTPPRLRVDAGAQACDEDREEPKANLSSQLDYGFVGQWDQRDLLWQKKGKQSRNASAEFWDSVLPDGRACSPSIRRLLMVQRYLRRYLNRGTGLSTSVPVRHRAVVEPVQRLYCKQETQRAPPSVPRALRHRMRNWKSRRNAPSSRTTFQFAYDSSAQATLGSTAKASSLSPPRTNHVSHFVSRFRLTRSHLGAKEQPSTALKRPPELRPVSKRPEMDSDRLIVPPILVSPGMLSFTNRGGEPEREYASVAQSRDKGISRVGRRTYADQKKLLSVNRTFYM